MTYTIPTTILANPSTLSVALWIHPLSYPASNVATPFAFGNAANNQQGPYFQFRSDGRINISLFTSNQLSGIGVFSIATAPLNTWTHIAFTYTSGNLSLYVNGIFQDTTAATGNVALYSSGGALTRVNIGCLYPTTFGYNGYVDDVRIYNTVLSLRLS